MAASLLLPDPRDPESAFFWEGTAREELRVQVCGNCGRRRHPPRPMCPACRSTERGFAVLSGRGRIWSFVVAHPPLLPAYAELAPYNVITVALEEDPVLRLVSNLVPGPGAGPGDLDPAGIRIGEPVRAIFEPVEEVFLPRFVRAG